MSLRSQLASKAETLQEFSIAAAEKYDEGQRLIAENDFGAGIYLLGYAAKMILKNAYFRFTGAAVSDEIGPRLFPAKAAGDDRHRGGLIPGISPESFHSLRFWAMLLQATRANQRRLIQEWETPGADPQPVLIEAVGERMSGSKHLYIIWDKWASLDQRERSEVIMDAYVATHAPQQVLNVTVAMGLTVAEAGRMGIRYETEAPVH